jgi:hypothetical protein
MVLNTLSDRVYSVRSTDVVCCCEFNIHISSINTVKNEVAQDLPYSRRGHNPSYP